MPKKEKMVENNNVLETGDRISNFSLQDQSGEVLEFYTTMISGGPIVFVVLAGGGEGNKSLLLALEEKLPEFASENAHLNVISNDTFESNAALSQELDLHFPLLADPGRRITDWFLSSAQARELAVFVLDPNQRLISFQTEAHGDVSVLISHALGEVKRIAPKDEPRLISAVAPVLVIPNVFSPDYCRRLIDLWATGGHEQAPVSGGEYEDQGREVNYGYFIRKDHTIIDREQTRELTNLLGSRLGPEIQKVFLYEKLIFEPYVIGCYETADAGFFKAHRDNFNENLQHRRFAFTINLNSEEYEGGDLRFPEYGADLYRPPTGGAIVFSCSLLHEVLPMTKGRRFMFQGFFGDVPAQQA
jgi:peroxiredoxin